MFANMFISPRDLLAKIGGQFAERPNRDAEPRAGVFVVQQTRTFHHHLPRRALRHERNRVGRGNDQHRTRFFDAAQVINVGILPEADGIYGRAFADENADRTCTKTRAQSFSAPRKLIALSSSLRCER
jgi:hypothetical protein